MDGPDHYRAGQRWLKHAEQAHKRLDQEPTTADKEVAAATQIASAHFLAAQTAATVHTHTRSSYVGSTDWIRAVEGRY